MLKAVSRGISEVRRWTVSNNIRRLSKLYTFISKKPMWDYKINMMCRMLKELSRATKTEILSNQSILCQAIHWLELGQLLGTSL